MPDFLPCIHADLGAGQKAMGKAAPMLRP
jgi:hypothetical protein